MKMYTRATINGDGTWTISGSKAWVLRIVDGTTEISRVVIGRALQKRAAGLADLPVPKGFGEQDAPNATLAAE